MVFSQLEWAIDVKTNGVSRANGDTRGVYISLFEKEALLWLTKFGSLLDQIRRPIGALLPPGKMGSSILSLRMRCSRCQSFRDGRCWSSIWRRDNLSRTNFPPIWGPFFELTWPNLHTQPDLINSICHAGIIAYSTSNSLAMTNLDEDEWEYVYHPSEKEVWKAYPYQTAEN